MRHPDLDPPMAPEDSHLIEKLAKLQSMFNQIGGLRSLLPEKLINPTRFALENPGGFNPEKLAGYLQSAAQNGSSDIQRFKKDWHSEDIRELLSAASAGELPQGVDAWSTDYVALLKQCQIVVDVNESLDTSGEQRQQVSIDDRNKILDGFKLRHPGVKAQVVDETQSLPLDIEIAKMTFRISLNNSVGGAAFKVVAKPDTTSTALRQEILASLDHLPTNISLADVLDLTASYQDITERPCDKCKKLVSNGALQLPYIRRPDKSAGKPTAYLAYHRDCA